MDLSSAAVWLLIISAALLLFFIILLWLGQVLAVKAHIKYYGEGQGIITDISRRKRR